jgi:hypothetical protein
MRVLFFPVPGRFFMFKVFQLDTALIDFTFRASKQCCPCQSLLWTVIIELMEFDW